MPADEKNAVGRPLTQLCDPRPGWRDNMHHLRIGGCDAEIKVAHAWPRAAEMLRLGECSPL
jgi:hypothetical protein